MYVSFFGNEPTPEISLALSRRLSSTFEPAEENKGEETKNEKNKVIDDHDNT